MPILSSIPGLGRLFSTESKDVERNELVIMIHPSIIYGDAQLDDYQREYDADSEVSRDARNSVGGRGVLPRRGTVAEPVWDKATQSYRQPVQQPYQQPQGQTGGGEAVAERNRQPVIATSPAQKALQNRRNELRNKRRR